MCIEDEQEDVEVEDEVFFRSCQQYRYLGVTIVRNGSMDQNIRERNIQGWKATTILHSFP